MPRLEYAPGVEGTEIHRVMSLVPEPRQKWRELDRTLRLSPVLDLTLKEDVRQALAANSGCAFCASVGTPRESANAFHEPRVALAIAYAEMLRTPADIDASTLEILKQEFTEPEIVELTCWSLFLIASQGFGAVMGVAAATDAERVAYHDDRSVASSTAQSNA